MCSACVQYVALSRARRLVQLHLWTLERDAIRADPGIAREYRRLAGRRLTQEFIEHHAPDYTPPQLPHLSSIDRVHADCGTDAPGGA